MSRILDKSRLSELIWRMRIEAPRIARRRKAGQFIILRPTTDCERIPLTIANAGEEWIEIIFQTAGATTMKLAALEIGDEISDLAGPLGNPTHIENFGSVLCIGGGVGIAPLFPIVTALKDAGNIVTTILGARNSGLIILEDEMRKVCDEVFVSTDDGSAGRKGFAVDIMDELVASGGKFDQAFIIGPTMMMKISAQKTIAHNIPTMVSLNPIMIDGTGMCGGCRVTVSGQTKFACVDGPEFDAAGIDWDTLLKRMGSYRQFETTAKEDHACHMMDVA